MAELGTTALAALDKALADRPNKDGHDFSEATRCLVAFRDSLIAAWRHSRAESDRIRMARVNAVLSVVVGGHFPLGPVPWTLLEAGRQELAAVTRETATGDPSASGVVRRDPDQARSGPAATNAAAPR